MNKKPMMLLAAGAAVVLAMFVGCGGRSGQKEYNKALTAWKKGNLAQARSGLEKSIRKMSGNGRKSEAWNNLGLVLWRLGEVDSAAEAFNESCVLSDSLTGANLNLGVALFHAGRIDAAEIALNDVLGDNPENETARIMLGLIAAQKRDWTGASRTIAKTAMANPSDPAAQNALALAELNNGRNADQIVARLKKLTAEHPDYAPATYNLGVIHEQWLRDQGTALGYYREYLRKTGESGSHANAANQAIARIKGGSAMPQTDPAAAARHMAEGARFHSAKNYTDAITQFEKAIQADPNQKNAHYNMGLAYYALKKYTAAEQACVNALRIDPRFADARYMLALSYFQQEKWAYAEREAKALEKIDPARGRQMLTHIENARNR